MDLIALAIPIFGAFIIIEGWYLKKQSAGIKPAFEEAVANVNVGIAERFFDICTTGLFHGLFVWLYENFALFTITSTWYWWIGLLLLTDLLWYWYHRLGHTVNIFWAAHVVHHQSDEFNFSVAARITVLQAGFRSIFWSFLPVLGFPPEMVTTILLVHGAYPFFTHTETIGNLGWLEHILVTPSHHRVHHSSNPCYLDKNYSDIFIIWDKLFGTFAKEGEKPVYGLTKPLNSHSFLWQHFHYFLEIALAWKRANNGREKIRILFGTPAMLDPVNRTILERRLLKRNQQFKASYFLKRYVVFQTLVSVLLVFILAGFHRHFNHLSFWFAGIALLVSLIISGAILEKKTWIFHLEAVRIVILAGWLFFIYNSFLVFLLLIGNCFLLIRFYGTLQEQYERLLFHKRK
ncbi:sterol desaturase family protein [Flavihumibacter sp. CACIAM 22H1]|uniref:sterol desaturase family protein n=1 Tax=Flavihumibacter sp. CACIAM 22H1 TaxID=1812911 RepID=UPI0007A7DA8D|nr:sterol desaturase family protein [Flavihumibacter sp. CACIAM 22H1]KYP15483.1 MAG: hypothetical protein A1D16_08290 [Flavihumibacter sp. CACIAM 22H1]